MKVVAYGIKPHEKILLATVNKKLHDITIISNDLTLETINYSVGKNALVLTNFASLTSQLMQRILENGIQLIISWNHRADDVIDRTALGDIKVKQLIKNDLEILTGDYAGINDDTYAIRFVRKTIETLNNWPEKVR